MAKIPEDFEQNYELIEYLAREYMGSAFVRTPLSAIMGYSQVLLKEQDGPINERQRADLESILYGAEQLWELINVFVNAVPFIFGKKNLYTKEIDLLQVISHFISHVQEKTKFQIEQDIPANLPTIEADESEIYKALYSIVSLIKQIHPTSEGKIDLSVGHSQDFVTVIVSTEKEIPLQLDPNPELFIARSIAELHGGKLQIESRDDNSWDISFTLPI